MKFYWEFDEDEEDDDEFGPDDLDI